MLTAVRAESRWLIVVCLCVCAGCGGSKGPELLGVTGTIKFNGKPLANAEVTFQPEKGAPSFAKTDAEGRYELQFSRSRNGALPGTHEVSIITAVEDDDGNVAKELLPAKYNINTELTATVSDDSEPIDFELDGSGEIIQVGEDDPDPEARPAGNPAGEFR